MPRLSTDFYARPSLDVAPELLGKILVRRTDSAILSGRIVETEAYGGEQDPGSHAFRGPTKRTGVMFGPPGHLYVYISYGAHFCVNVVTDKLGIAGAVLIRALEPLEGITAMARNRGNRPHVDLCNGPGKLCQALQITIGQNGTDLGGDVIWIEDDAIGSVSVATSTRVGLSRGKEHSWRFYVSDSQFVSRGRPSVP